jgi:hypothetical protein
MPTKSTEDWICRDCDQTFRKKDLPSRCTCGSYGFDKEPINKPTKENEHVRT